MLDLTLKYWVITALLLGIKMWVNSQIQVYWRFRYHSLVVPEDAETFKKLTGKTVGYRDEEHPLVKRAGLSWRNDLENIPFFLITSLGYVLAGGSSEWAILYFSAYFLARSVYTASYLMQLQPWRTLSYEVGFISTYAMIIHTLYIVW